MGMEMVQDKIQDVLKIVGLFEDTHKKVGAYSRGMRQRLGIAEVLIKDPKVMFLDEPTLGLDPDGALRMIDLIQALNEERKMTVLLSVGDVRRRPAERKLGVPDEGFGLELRGEAQTDMVFGTAIGHGLGHEVYRQITD